MLAPQLDEDLERHKSQETFPERVRATIQRRLIGRPECWDIASELHISSRTMQWRLRDVGYSFQQVLEEAGHQLTRHYMSNPVLELNETAYFLGYEDPNSFVCAFLIWEGVRPAHWRESQREKPHPRFFTDQIADRSDRNGPIP
jgi:AraC-like DNA-binding protein